MSVFRRPTFFREVTLTIWSSEEELRPIYENVYKTTNFK